MSGFFTGDTVEVRVHTMRYPNKGKCIARNNNMLSVFFINISC